MIANDLDICIDCLMFLANGEYDPELTEDECNEYDERVSSAWDGWEITLGTLECEWCSDDEDECESTGFTFSACDLCDSTGPWQGGGERYHATAWPVTPEASGYSYRRLVYTVGSLQADLARANRDLDTMTDNRDELETDLAGLVKRLEAYEPPTPAELAARMARGV